MRMMGGLFSVDPRAHAGEEEVAVCGDGDAAGAVCGEEEVSLLRTGCRAAAALVLVAPVAQRPHMRRRRRRPSAPGLRLLPDA